MATLTRKTVYKNGGASYTEPGRRASIYCGPRMFDGPAPETVEFNAPNLSTPGAEKNTDEAKAAKLAAKAEAKTARETERAAKKAEREAARAKAKADRETARAEAKAKREEERAKITAARSAGNIAPSAPAGDQTGEAAAPGL